MDTLYHMNFLKDFKINNIGLPFRLMRNSNLSTGSSFSLVE